MSLFGTNDQRKRVEDYYRRNGSKNPQCCCVDCAHYNWAAVSNHQTVCIKKHISVRNSTPACSSFEIHSDLLKKGV
jgi:hypothetical protein